MSNFPARLHEAREALRKARILATPLDAETAQRVQARCTAEAWAAMERDIAEHAAAIPTLQAEADRLAAMACTRCAGTGDYQAPTRHVRRGRPVCFACGGTGTRKDGAA